MVTLLMSEAKKPDVMITPSHKPSDEEARETTRRILLKGSFPSSQGKTVIGREFKIEGEDGTFRLFDVQYIGDMGVQLILQGERRIPLVLTEKDEDGHYVFPKYLTLLNDHAMSAQLQEGNLGTKGGIDLSSDKALSVQNNGQGIKFHIDPAMLQQLQNAPGFVPVIINIQPLKSLPAFLGLDQNNASF